MKKNRMFLSVLVFVLFVSVYFFFLKPMFVTEDEVVNKVDDFTLMDNEFWYVGSMSDHRELKGQADIEKGVLILKKIATGEDLYLLSKPIPLGKKQILTVKRRIKVNPGKEYFSGGLVFFQTSAKTRLINPAEKHPMGSAFSIIEYVYDPAGSGIRPGTKNIRILSPDWQETKSYELVDPVFNKWFDEEIVYNSYTGQLDYTVNGETYSVFVPIITDDSIRIWMHAYGNSKNQQIEVDNFEIKLENLEESDMRKE